ncbi:MAG: glycoside hydrolase family 2 TIM barrel-domain containing protein [Bacteroidota bacterium]|nr:glycoside hydrolase family 2 TIM barrel-domain containing protein [Bacteroidota bacterium]
MNRIRYAFYFLIFILSTQTFRAFSGKPVDVLPVFKGNNSLSLNGNWKFKYIHSSNTGTDSTFFQPSFDVNRWKSIPVPGHWELHGFAPKQYGKVDEGTGLYRHTFLTPATWKGDRIFLRFDGVLYGMTIWINGKEVGKWASSYNPSTFDVTDALLPAGKINTIAVRVTTRCKGWDFDTNDCWALSGIYREVTLFALPVNHFTDYTVQTELAPDGTAKVKLDVAATRSATVSGRLISPAGQPVQTFRLPLDKDAHGTTNLTVTNPALWTAETPSLYRLELTLIDGVKPVQVYTAKIGLRQVTISDGILKLNGVPIKLHGVDHHDLWPLEGRVASDELIRRDLTMIRNANINFIRTSHYPPHPHFIEMCDEMGIYVLCEVPFGYGDKNLTDPSYQEVLYTRARATVMRDKNHPSVIIWSVGNENPTLLDLPLNTGKRVKELDPSRPICFPTMGSYFEKNLQEFMDAPSFMDVYASHYPVAKTLYKYASLLKRPIIFTEYAHALGLATDRVQDEWAIMQKSPRIAGGAVWMFQDQGLLTKSDKPVDPNTPTKTVWTDQFHYYDTNTTAGVDGIVYSDRTPQVDYWQVRKVYSPIQIAERSAMVHSGKQDLLLHLENRFDFQSLKDFSLQWTLNANDKPIGKGTVQLAAKPHQVEQVTIPVNLPTDLWNTVYTLKTKCTDKDGHSIYERAIKLDPEKGGYRAAALLAGLPVTGEPKIVEDGKITRVINDHYELHLNQNNGDIQILNRDGQIIVSGIFPHVGRKFTMAEELRAQKDNIWKGSFLKHPELQQAEVNKTAEGVAVHVRGKYTANGNPDQFITGEISLLIKSHGELEVSYDFTPVKAKGYFLEAGLSFLAPGKLSEFRWLGQGPYAGYPGKDELNEFGSYHLNSGDLHFQGNRRNVEIAILSGATGKGLALAGNPMDIAVENTTDGIVLNHNALISGLGNKGSAPETQIKADEVQHITGKFTILPLNEVWPLLLTKWFGPATLVAKPFHPFYHSYDQ